MDSSTAVSAGGLGIIGEVEQKIFKSSLFGFKRDDVLSYVEKLNRENSVAAEALRDSIKQLEASLSEKTADNNTITEKANALEFELSQAQVRAETAEELVKALRIEADTANDEAASYKSRLFTKEQEAVVLKADNARLNQEIARLTASVTEYERMREESERIKQDAILLSQTILEQAKDEAESIKNDAMAEKEQIEQAARAEADALRMQADNIKTSAEFQALEAKKKAEAEAKLLRSKASNDAVALVSAAEKEKLAAKQLVSGSAENIANSIIVLKAELAEVDKRITTAVSEFSKITGGISGALYETEKNLQSFGIQLEKFPQPVKPIQHYAKEKHAMPKRKTVSESILETLTKLLK